MNHNPASVPAAEIPAHAAAKPDPRAAGLGALALAVLVFLAYLPSLRGGFIWDDLLLVDQNPLVKGDFNLRSIWFGTDFPLSNVALWLEWLAFGKNATGYRVVNALLHAGSCVLLWRLLARLEIRGAWLAAALFAVHPVCVASVAWISELKNTLSLPFYLLSAWGFLIAEADWGAGRASRARIRYWLSLGAFLLALLVKTSTVMLPVVLLGCAWWRRGRIAKTDWLRTAPYFALALAFGLMTVWFQSRQTLAGFTLPPESFATKLAGAGMAVWFYLGKALLPLELNAIYPRWGIDPRTVLVYLPLVLLGVAAAVCWWFRRSWGRSALFVLGCFAVSLFPTLGFFDMYFLVFSRVSDHFQYLALPVVLAGVAALLSLIGGKLILRVFGAVVIAAACLLTTQRARVYASDESLWRDTLAKNPAAWNAHNNIGCLLAEKNDLAAAVDHFRASLKLNPRNTSAHSNLGRALLLSGNFTEAEKHFRTVLEIKPDHLDTLKTYGTALAGQGRTAEAVKLLRQALQLRPDDEVRLQLAPLLSATGQDADAVKELRLVLSAQPDSAEALNNLAWILATSADDKVRDGAEAVRLAEKACQLTGQQEPIMVGALAAAYAEAGQFTNAVVTAQRAITLARAAGNEGFAQMNRQLLQLYRAGRPYHSPPAMPVR